MFRTYILTNANQNTPSVRRSPKSFPLKGRTLLTSVEALSLQGERDWDRGVWDLQQIVDNSVNILFRYVLQALQNRLPPPRNICLLSIGHHQKLIHLIILLHMIWINHK
jgi:hypothetical protein